MTRKVVETNFNDDDNYVTVVTGGPTKFYNRRRVRKVFARLEGMEPFQPITSEWFTKMVSDTIFARHRQGMTQQTLARLLGTSQPAISRLESGKSNPTAEFLDRLWQKLTMSVEFIDKSKD